MLCKSGKYYARNPKPTRTSQHINASDDRDEPHRLDDALTLEAKPWWD